MKLNLGSGEHPLDGFVNLDLPDWEWANGLHYPDNSVEAITVSHALMYAPEYLWPFIFAEMARVLVPGGIVRITEDSTDDPRSERFGGFQGAVTLTSVKKVEAAMRGRFSVILHVAQTQTLTGDYSLIQRWHGEPPKVFHIEGRK